MTRITVCQFETRAERLDAAWEALRAHAATERPDLLLLPEMALCPWLAASREPDHEAWAAGERAHRRRIEELGELGVPVVCGTMPIVDDGRRFNEAFVWTEAEGHRPVHRKTYLPDEVAFWEASWYERGPTTFETADTPAGRIGFLVCTELWFMDRAREYAAAGVDFLLCPRATEIATLDKWIAGGRVAATISGAFCLSSNHADRLPEVTMAGGGWICAAEDGALLGVTTAEAPFLTLDVDVAEARAAKETYPRYVDDSPR